MGEVPVLVTREDHRRLTALKETRFEPFWSVVNRLLNEHYALEAGQEVSHGDSDRRTTV